VAGVIWAYVETVSNFPSRCAKGQSEVRQKRGGEDDLKYLAWKTYFAGLERNRSKSVGLIENKQTSKSIRS
jgi:hypothetical protein